MNSYLVFKNGKAVYRICALDRYDALNIVKQLKPKYGKGKYTVRENL